MIICDRCGTGKQYARIRQVTIVITGDTDFDNGEDRLPKTIVAQDLCKDCKNIVRDAFVKAMQPPPQPAKPVEYTIEQIKNVLDKENYFDYETKEKLISKLQDLGF